MNTWEIQRADKFCNFVTDGTHDSPKAKKGGRRLITSKHLKGYYVDFDSANFISEEDYLKVIARSPVEQWDILYSMIGTIGNLYLEKNKYTDYACKNMGIFKFGGNRGKAYWMYYYLKSPKAINYIQSHLRESTQSYVPLGTLRELPIPVPPENIRSAIIGILRPIDEQIESNNAINKNLCPLRAVRERRKLRLRGACSPADVDFGERIGRQPYSEWPTGYERSTAGLAA